MEKHAPLVSTRTVGPLGLAHLPRLWLKVRLAAKGKLADGYRSGEGGFDGLLLDALGIGSADVVEFISTSQPSYLEFEDWVKENAKADSLTAEAIEEMKEKFKDGKKMEDARMTVLHNGVLVHDNLEVKRKTGAGKPEGSILLPTKLQNHGNPVRYRNIWAVEK